MKNNDKFPAFFLIAGAGVAAFLVYYAGNLYGPRFTYDSINYLYAGHSLWEQGKWLRPFEEPYIQWPPLYSTLIALNFYLAGNLLKGIFYFQVLVAGFTVWFSGKFAFRLIQQPVIFSAAYLAIVFATPVIVVNHFVWSESFFVLLVIIHIFILTHYLSHKQSIYWYILIITGSLLCLQRHIGLFLIMGTISAFWLYDVKKPLKQKILSIGYYSLLSVIPLLAWWLRNYIVQRQIINDYRDSLFTISFTKHWLAYQDVFTAWFLPNEIPAWIRIIFVSTIFFFLFLQYSRYYRMTRSSVNMVGVITLLFASYFLLTYVASLIVNEFIDDRILAPAYIPCVLILFCLIDNYIGSLKNMFLKKICLYICLFWTVYPITRTIVNTYRWHHQKVDLPISQPVEAEFYKYIQW